MECLPLAHFEHVVPSRWRCLRLCRKYVTEQSLRAHRLAPPLFSLSAFCLWVKMWSFGFLCWLPAVIAPPQFLNSPSGTISQINFSVSHLVTNARGGEGREGKERGGESPSTPLHSFFCDRVWKLKNGNNHLVIGNSHQFSLKSKCPSMLWHLPSIHLDLGPIPVLERKKRVNSAW